MMDVTSLVSQLSSLQRLTHATLETLDYQSKLLGISQNCITKGSDLVKTATIAVKELQSLLNENERARQASSLEEMESLNFEEGSECGTPSTDTDLVKVEYDEFVEEDRAVRIEPAVKVKAEPEEEPEETSKPDMSAELFDDFEDEEEIDANMLAMPKRKKFLNVVHDYGKRRKESNCWASMKAVSTQVPVKKGRTISLLSASTCGVGQRRNQPGAASDGDGQQINQAYSSTNKSTSSDLLNHLKEGTPNTTSSLFVPDVLVKKYRTISMLSASKFGEGQRMAQSSKDARLLSFDPKPAVPKVTSSHQQTHPQQTELKATYWHKVPKMSKWNQRYVPLGVMIKNECIENDSETSIKAGATQIHIGKGLAIQNSASRVEQGLEMNQTSASTIEQDLEIDQTCASTSEQDLEMNQTRASTSEQDLEIDQTSASTIDQDLEIDQTRTLTNEQDLEMNVTSASTSEQDLEIDQTSTSTSEQDLETGQTCASTREHDLEIDQTSTLTSEQDLEIDQTSTSASEQDLEIDQTSASTSEQDLEIDQTSTSTDEQDLEIDQTSASTSDQDLEIDQTSTSTSKQVLAMNQTRTSTCERDLEIDQSNTSISE